MTGRGEGCSQLPQAWKRQVGSRFPTRLYYPLADENRFVYRIPLEIKLLASVVNSEVGGGGGDTELRCNSGSPGAAKGWP